LHAYGGGKLNWQKVGNDVLGIRPILVLSVIKSLRQGTSNANEGASGGFDPWGITGTLSQSEH
jgi:hypothetical protein